MADILRMNFDNGSEGGNVATSPWVVNGGAGAFDAMEAGVTFQAAGKQHGTYGIVSPAGASGYARKDFSSKTISHRTGLKPLGDPVVTGDVYTYRLGVGTTMYISIRIVTTTGKLRVQDYGGVTYTATNPLASNGDYWYEINVDSGTTASNGKIRCAYYNKDSTTPIQTLLDLTNVNAGAGVTFTRAYMLKYGTPGPQYAFDDLVLTDTFDTIGLYPPANTPPSLSLAAGSSTLFPGQITTITATASDVDGDTPSLAWSTNLGTLSGSGTSRVFLAPPLLADATATVTVTATDNQSAQTTQTVNILCKASSKSMFNGVSKVPLVRRINV